MTILAKVQVNIPTTGNGATINIGSTAAGYQSFVSAGAANNVTYSFGIIDIANQWEVGQGTYITNSSGLFFIMTAINYSSNGANSFISLSGAAQLYTNYLQYDYDQFQPGNNVTIGNTTANAFANSTIESIANNSAQTTYTPNSIRISGTGANQGLILGTSSLGAAATNGYSFMPNGLLLQWGTGVCNTTSNTFTFPTPFPTACFQVVATPANIIFIGANTPYVVNANSSVCHIASAAASASVNVNYIAVGN